ncbi:hypothetical protein [Ligilactobacillus equi]|uniref:Type I site-specific deoxyribonuclease n=2 Tax=Ligilactobacillus equi TaxID=137357 RepID=V7HW87_9LACO|nr:hypothetical protein [Ligilactobacillus equi]ETA74504.1 type I site-specific deoxyribonuclease [Ligilactobacillus equi DPC 6820]KRL78128.1 hypothetical protein FC36_GL001178 [Ligilactobacillus equi DSM 15833 = JCM 10991]
MIKSGSQHLFEFYVLDLLRKYNLKGEIEYEEDELTGHLIIVSPNLDKVVFDTKFNIEKLDFIDSQQKIKNMAINIVSATLLSARPIPNAGELDTDFIELNQKTVDEFNTLGGIIEATMV